MVRLYSLLFQAIILQLTSKQGIKCLSHTWCDLFIHILLRSPIRNSWKSFKKLCRWAQGTPISLHKLRQRERTQRSSCPIRAHYLSIIGLEPQPLKCHLDSIIENLWVTKWKDYCPFLNFSAPNENKTKKNTYLRNTYQNQIGKLKTA